MTNFSFTKIDIPAPVTPYVYISADGVDAAGDAVGNYGNVDGEGDGTFHGFTAEGGTGTTFDPPVRATPTLQALPRAEKSSAIMSTLPTSNTASSSTTGS